MCLLQFIVENVCFLMCLLQFHFPYFSVFLRGVFFKIFPAEPSERIGGGRRQGERERERGTEGERERERESKREQERDRERKRVRGRWGQRERETERKRE